jgi:prefoldin beta subunit
MTTVIDDKLKTWRGIDSDVSALFNQKTQALSQFNENTMVKGELDLLGEGDHPVYKLVGPVLMAVDLEEAKENVAKRVEFIETEIKKLDAAIAVKQGDQATLGEEISKLQSEMQKEAAEAAQAAAAVTQES